MRAEYPTHAIAPPEEPAQHRRRLAFPPTQRRESVGKPKPFRQLTQQALEQGLGVAVTQGEVQVPERLGRHCSVEPHPAGQEELEEADGIVILGLLPSGADKSKIISTGAG